MADTAAAPAATPSKKKAAKKPGKPKAPSSHPPTINMVKAAIKASNDRKGTSLISIKKYIAANYKVDMNKMNSVIKRCIKNAADKGVLVRVGNKGTGATGSFKLPAKVKATEGGEKKPKAVKKPKAKKVATGEKKPKAAKSPKAKKPKAAKSPKPKKAKTPKKAKSPAKPKAPKAPKAAKSPKPKKAAAKKPKKSPAKKAGKK